MKAYIVKNNIKIEPFLEENVNLLIGNKKISDWYSEIFRKLKINCKVVKDVSEIDGGEERVVFDDNVFFTFDLMKEFILLSKKTEKNTVCAVKKGIFTTRSIINSQNVEDCGEFVSYNLFYFPSKNKNPNPIPIIFDLDQGARSLVFPNHMVKDGKYSIPFQNKIIVQLDHWANVWAANLIYFLSHLYELERNKFGIFLGILKSLSFNKWRILAKINKINKSSDVHHTAYIEGSVIGKNVTIGAGSVIRHSMIDDDSYIGNGVIIESSIIGTGCVILNGHILQSVLYPESFSVTHFISASILGKRTFVGSGAVLTDFRFDKKCMTIKRGHDIFDSQNIFLGCCLGNDVYLGGGCVVAPGREIVNSTKISLSKDKIITNPIKSDDFQFSC